jgi:hypothetical protein
MEVQTKAILENFVGRARLLGSSTYLTAAKAASIEPMPKGPCSAPNFDEPEREQLEAFVMRLRFFIQNNESTSLENISKLFQNDQSVSPTLKQEFEKVRVDLRTAFDSLPPIQVTSKNDPVPPTWGEIWDVFVYGDVAHANQAKRERYERWRNHPPSYTLCKYYLSRIFLLISSGIVFVADLMEKEIQSGSTSNRAGDAKTKGHFGFLDA